MEARSVDEATEMLEQSQYYENQNKMLDGPKPAEEDDHMLHESMMNQSILVEDYEQSPVEHFVEPKKITVKKEEIDEAEL